MNLKTLAYNPENVTYDEALAEAQKRGIPAIATGLSTRMLADGLKYNRDGFAVHDEPAPSVPISATLAPDEQLAVDLDAASTYADLKNALMRRWPKTR